MLHGLVIPEMAWKIQIRHGKTIKIKYKFTCLVVFNLLRYRSFDDKQ